MPALRRGLRRGAAGALILAALACSAPSENSADAAILPRPQCSLLLQDCPTGEKCIDDRCVPAGDATLGAACQLDAEKVDTCASGLRCSPLGVATSLDGSSPRACRALCLTDRHCTVAGERCTGTPARPGVCVTPCALFGSDCPADRTCAYPLTGTDFSTCRAAGARALGEACVADVECPADSVCLGRGDPTPRCYRLCDTVDRGIGAHGCAEGRCAEVFPQRWIGVCSLL